MAHDAKHKKSRKGGAAKMILIVLLILVLAAGGCLLAIRKEINGSASAGEPVSVSIQQGSGVAAIAQKLKTAGVIKYPHVFRWYAGKQGAAGKLQYGEFDLAPGSSYDDIIEALSAYAKADSVRLTFPEGTTAIAIAKKMEDAGLCSAEDFLKEANTGDFSQYRFWQYVPDDKDAPDRFLKCEGYLFPDTYDFLKDDTVHHYVETFYSHFDKQITDEMYAEMEKQGMTLSEVVTLASFVQEEAGNDQDDNVAQVFRNRLAEVHPTPNCRATRPATSRATPTTTTSGTGSRPTTAAGTAFRRTFWKPTTPTPAPASPPAPSPTPASRPSVRRLPRSPTMRRRTPISLSQTLPVTTTTPAPTQTTRKTAMRRKKSTRT